MMLSGSADTAANKRVLILSGAKDLACCSKIAGLSTPVAAATYGPGDNPMDETPSGPTLFREVRQ